MNAYFNGLPTPVLEAMLKGYEWQLDQAHAGVRGYQSYAWLVDRLDVIRKILYRREAEAESRLTDKATHGKMPTLRRPVSRRR